MDTTVLDPEKFNAMKELATISENIAKGEAVLKELKETTDAYVLEREENVKARIAEILKESYESLQKISENRDALQRYASELGSFASGLMELLKEYRALKVTLDEKAELDGKSLKEALEKIASARQQLEIQRGTIQADADANSRERAWIAEEKRKLADERATLDRAIIRLKEGRI